MEKIQCAVCQRIRYTASPKEVSCECGGKASAVKSDISRNQTLLLKARKKHARSSDFK